MCGGGGGGGATPSAGGAAAGGWDPVVFAGVLTVLAGLSTSLGGALVFLFATPPEGTAARGKSSSSSSGRKRNRSQQQQDDPASSPPSSLRRRGRLRQEQQRGGDDHADGDAAEDAAAGSEGDSLSRVMDPGVLGVMLGFAAGVMLFISFVDVLPDAAAVIGRERAGAWFFAGALVFAVGAKALMPSEETIQRWFLRSTSGTAAADDDDDGVVAEQTSLASLGLLMAVSISAHNAPEGIAVFLAALRGPELGLPLAIAMVAHNIPEGAVVAAPIYAVTGSRTRAMVWATMSGVCEPAGALLFATLFRAYLVEEVVFALLAAVAGIMVHLCSAELIPSAIDFADAGARAKAAAGGVSDAATQRELREAARQRVALASLCGMAMIFVTVCVVDTRLKSA